MADTDNARLESLLHVHTQLVHLVCRYGRTPALEANLDAVEAEIDALAEAAEIAHYGAAL